jgi:hypothetical protein
MKRNTKSSGIASPSPENNKYPGDNGAGKIQLKEFEESEITEF